MYCRKCGNKLLDDDLFCSKCGAKVIHDSPQSAVNNKSVTDSQSESTKKELSAADSQTESTEESWVSYLFVYLIAFIVITIWVVAMLSRISVMDFVTAPEGLLRFLGECAGTALFSLLFLWPLLGKLADFGMVPKHWKIHAFFLMMFAHEFGNLFLGQTFSRAILPPVLLIALIAGVVVRITSSSKKK